MFSAIAILRKADNTGDKLAIAQGWVKCVYISQNNQMIYLVEIPFIFAWGGLNFQVNFWSLLCMKQVRPLHTIEPASLIFYDAYTLKASKLNGLLGIHSRFCPSHVKLSLWSKGEKVSFNCYNFIPRLKLPTAQARWWSMPNLSSLRPLVSPCSGLHGRLLTHPRFLLFIKYHLLHKLDSSFKSFF